MENSLTLSPALRRAAREYFAHLPEDRNVVQPADLFARLAAGEPLLTVDLRGPEAYARSHLKGAVNLPFGPALAEALPRLPAGRTLVLCSATGQSSSQATALLNILGRPALHLHSGWERGVKATPGWEAWAETEPHALPAAPCAPADPEARDALEGYFAAMAASPWPRFAIPADRFRALWQGGGAGYALLSVRQAADYAEAHIDGAANLPFGAGMERGFAALDPARPLVVYCYTGQTASQTVAVLRLLGFEAYNLTGGVGDAASGAGWLGCGGPVTAG